MTTDKKKHKTKRKTKKKGLTKKQIEYVVNELTGKPANHDRDEELAKELGVLTDDIIDLMTEHGYTYCPECSTYVESGDMIPNPEDDSEQVCDACAIGQGW
jgi:hypothetical protein